MRTIWNGPDAGDTKNGPATITNCQKDRLTVVNLFKASVPETERLLKQGIEIQWPLDHLLFKGVRSPFPDQSVIVRLHGDVDLIEVGGRIGWIIPGNRLNDGGVGPQIFTKPVRRFLVVLRNEQDRPAQGDKISRHLARML